MGTSRWIRVLADTALPEGGLVPVFPLGLNVLLVRAEGRAYAVSGRCAHMACPLLGGRLEGHTLTCGCHDWRFDVRTGTFVDAPEIKIKTYPLKSEAGELLVDIEGSTP
jgi:3-phenylpropionate/trans-cinnamate dioxygenase ferredoxin subunit